MGPELLLRLAERNKISLPYTTLEEAQAAYRFTDMQSFIDAYLANTRVICTGQDFYDITLAYLASAAAQGVCHIELFVEVGAYVDRGIGVGDIIEGVHAALCEAKIRFGM